jgi:hypothetical protein
MASTPKEPIRNNQASIPNCGERYRQGGDDLDGLRRIDHQAGGELAVGEEAADVLDATRGTSPVASTDQCLEY